MEPPAATLVNLYAVDFSMPSILGAGYQGFPFQGILKCTRIGRDS